MTTPNEPSQQNFFSQVLSDMSHKGALPSPTTSDIEEVVRRVVTAMITTGNTDLPKEAIQRVIAFEQAVLEMRKHRMSIMQGIAEYSKEYQEFLAANPHIDDKSLEVIEELHEQNLATMSDRGGQAIAAIDGRVLGDVVHEPEPPSPPETTYIVQPREPFKLEGCRAQLAILAITFVLVGILIAQQDPATNNTALVPGCLATIVLFGGLAFAFRVGF